MQRCKHRMLKSGVGVSQFCFFFGGGGATKKGSLKMFDEVGMSPTFFFNGGKFLISPLPPRQDFVNAP